MRAADSPARRARRSASAEEDAGLVRAIAERRPEALARLYERYAGMLLGLAHKILGRRADAEEVLQEAFLQVWNQAERYDRSRSSVSTWLVLIARSRSIDRLRSRKVGERTATAAQRERPRLHTSPEGVRDVLTLERGQRLRQELEKLPVEQRSVLEMAFFQGMTQSEIAAKTSIPLGTVKTRTLLAMKKLRKALQEEMDELL